MRDALLGKLGNGWAYTVLLTVLLAMWVAQPLAGRSLIGASILSLSYAAVLISAVAVVSHRRTLVLLALVLMLPAAVLTVLPRAAGAAAHLWGSTLSLLALALIIASFLVDLFRHPQVTIGTIGGSVCVYVLTGVAWMFMYDLVDVLAPGAFEGLSAVGTSTRQSELFYFSFVTLTTLGYGDIVPTRPESMSLATLEAVVGQLYLVVLVATFVSRRSQAHG